MNQFIYHMPEGVRIIRRKPVRNKLLLSIEICWGIQVVVGALRS